MNRPKSSELSSGFAALGLESELLRALTTLGYEEPTPIQREAIPPLLAGHDVMGLAATGTGKTAAFALPLLQRISKDAQKPPQVSLLVLVPTRELAMQVSEALHRYGKALGTSVLPIYGGQSMDLQLRALRRGVDAVVATPGRALDHIRRGTLRLDNLKAVVLDEADEMLDMGFADDLEAILNETPKSRQTALFSATLARRIASIAARHLKDPVHVNIAREVTPAGAIPRVRELVYVINRHDKIAALGRVLDMENPTSAIVFCRTRNEVDELSDRLSSRGYKCEPLHGGLSQEQRDRVMKRFRSNTSELLIATDVAARGLDVEHISHVINFDVPASPEVYVHRIGRTGRAGREGVAITLAEPREQRLLRNIEQLTKRKLKGESVPTTADLRSRRLELVTASLRELLVENNHEGFRVVINALSSEFDVLDIAAAAVKMAHTAEGYDSQDEVEINSPNSHRGSERGDRGERGGDPRRSNSGQRPKPGRPEGRRGGNGGAANWEVARLHLSIGRDAGVRPKDVVGAMANELGLDPRAVGSIEIGDRYSMVEVPAEIADDLIDAFSGTRLKGKRVIAKRA